MLPPASRWRLSNRGGGPNLATHLPVGTHAWAFNARGGWLARASYDSPPGLGRAVQGVRAGVAARDGHLNAPAANDVALLRRDHGEGVLVAVAARVEG